MLFKRLNTLPGADSVTSGSTSGPFSASRALGLVPSLDSSTHPWRQRKPGRGRAGGGARVHARPYPSSSFAALPMRGSRRCRCALRRPPAANQNASLPATPAINSGVSKAARSRLQCTRALGHSSCAMRLIGGNLANTPSQGASKRGCRPLTHHPIVASEGTVSAVPMARRWRKWPASAAAKLGYTR